MEPETFSSAMPLWEKSETIAAFAKAWPKAQADMGAVLKDRTNPAFRSKYADLGNVIDAVLPALNKAGFGLSQFPAYDPASRCVICRTEIMHESGEWKAAVLHVPVTKTDAQGIGSAITYGRRYGLQAFTGVAPEDDDGNAAVGQGNSHAAAAKAPDKAEAAQRTPTLAERATKFEGTLKAVTNAADLRKAYELGAKLCADLDAADPERLAEINSLYEARFNELSERAAA